MPPIFYLVFSLLFLLSPSTGLIAKPGCGDRCGSLPIPFPFGVGSDCSYNSFFTIDCNSSTDPPKPYLAIIEAEVVEIYQTYVRVKYPNLVSTCYDLLSDNWGTGTAETFHETRTLNLSGTPYALSSNNVLTAIGCDDVMLQSNGSLARGGGGGCSAFCARKNDTGVGYCPSAGSSLGNGCCQVGMYPGFSSHSIIGAQLLDSSGTLGRMRLHSCSYAFVNEKTNPNETVFSYPLYYLDNYTALLDDNWASAARMPVLRLDWFFEADNCSQAKLNAATYACLDDKSVCVGHVNFDSGHYLCSCALGYEGNPYLPGGCQRISVSSSIAKLGCLDQCGNLSIPFPFGVGPSCSSGPSFEISCNTSTNPPEGYLTILNKKIYELNSTTVLVEYPNVGSSCFDLSNASKVMERRLIFDLSETQYTLSDENWITAIGRNDMVMVLTGENSWASTSMRSSCAAISSDFMEMMSNMATCPSGSTTYSSGDGCCRASIPTGTKYLTAYLKNLRGEWTSSNISCSYAFIQYNRKDDSYPVAYTKMDDSTMIEPIIDGGPKTVKLDWRIGDANCRQVQRDPANYMCQVNSECVNFDATVGGYRCNCSQGFQGNPYLTPGCQDIDECADDTTNTCSTTSSCVNTPGSYNCVCPEGHFGDGRKYGAGCIKLPPSKSKMMILIGLGSGSGFLLLFSMCIWLYGALRRRKLKIVKEKFFKRNGGLLLQQQTNEGVLGKTKVFTSNELDVATDHFNDNRILGQGGQGTVYKGMLSDGKIVAVKKSKLVEENQLDQFINEVAILSQINHRNVVKLLGCCLETEVPLLVYEFMPNGTLFDLIHDQNNEFPFTWNIRLKIAADIAGALAYLHYASSIPIYHRDIKSSNILLDEKYVVKVSDFGTSRTVSVDQTHLTTLVKGTFGYLDPEYFQSSQFTEKSDVYSFGVVLVELLTRQRAISLERTDSNRSLATRFLTCMEGNCLDSILDLEIREDNKTEGVVILVARLAQRCLNLQGKMRPTMKEVATELESLRTPPNVVKGDELEEVNIFKGKPLMTSDAEYTWTSSSNSNLRLSSDSHPLVFGTE